jgi:hypothetical protein
MDEQTITLEVRNVLVRTESGPCVNGITTVIPLNIEVTALDKSGEEIKLQIPLKAWYRMGHTTPTAIAFDFRGYLGLASCRSSR